MDRRGSGDQRNFTVEIALEPVYISHTISQGFWRLLRLAGCKHLACCALAQSLPDRSGIKADLLNDPTSLTFIDTDLKLHFCIAKTPLYADNYQYQDPLDILLSHQRADEQITHQSGARKVGVGNRLRPLSQHTQADTPDACRATSTSTPRLAMSQAQTLPYAADPQDQIPRGQPKRARGHRRGGGRHTAEGMIQSAASSRSQQTVPTVPYICILSEALDFAHLT